MTEDEMVGGIPGSMDDEFEQTPGDGEGHGGLVSCSQWDHQELDWTVQLKNSKKLILKQY